MISQELYFAELKKRNLAPENIQFAKWENLTLVSTFSKADNLFISENVSMGIDKSPNLALLKALSEFCERKIMNTSSDKAAKYTKRSDGFAAFPQKTKNAKIIVAKNALNEAIERYLWATWWDDESVEYHIENYDLPKTWRNALFEFNIETLKFIKITPDNHETSLFILLAKLKNAGYVTGGAAGALNSVEETTTRAFGELLRHLIVVKKMLEKKAPGVTFYEKRLIGFGSGFWNDLVEKRLNISGKIRIKLPPLIINEEINHPDSDLIIVYRCLFERQPEFMGGEIARLCI